MRETPILHEVREFLAGEPDVTVWRNNSGGELVVPKSGRRRFIRYGLGIGAADLIGILHPYGRWLSIEIKSDKGRSRPEQILWGATVQRAGGFYAVVRSVDEARDALARARAGALQ